MLAFSTSNFGERLSLPPSLPIPFQTQDSRENHPCFSLSLLLQQLTQNKLCRLLTGPRTYKSGLLRATFANKRRGIKAAGTVGHKHHVQYSIVHLKKTCFLSLSKKKGLNRYFDVTFPLYPLLPKPFENFLHSHKNANVRKDLFCGVWENPVLSHLFFFFFREKCGWGKRSRKPEERREEEKRGGCGTRKRFLFCSAAKGIRRGKQYLTDMSGSYGD